MVCISATNNSCTAYIRSSEGGRIESSGSLKILGFHFDTNPSPKLHVEKLVKKFNSRLWTLRYLRTAGMSTADLKTAYITFLRPLAEYAVPAFHSMLSGEQTALIENLQRKALKIIYGFNHSYDTLLERSSLDSLKTRRVNLTDKFAINLQKNPKYTHLFPERPEDQLRVRNPKPYIEEHARTARLYNSPLFYMRRRLNELAQEEALQRRQVQSASTRNNEPRCDFIFDEWR